MTKNLNNSFIELYIYNNSANQGCILSMDDNIYIMISTAIFDKNIALNNSIYIYII